MMGHWPVGKAIELAGESAWSLSHCRSRRSRRSSSSFRSMSAMAANFDRLSFARKGMK